MSFRLRDRSRHRGNAEVMIVARASGLQRRTAVDAIGLVLVGAAIGWTLMVAGGLTDGAWPIVALYAGSAAAYVAGRAIGARIPWLLPALVVAVSLWVGWLSVSDWLRDGRMDQPFGYPNAQAGFFVLTVTGSLMFASVSRRLLPRAVGFVLALGFAGVVVISGSVAAVILLALPAVALAVRAQGLARWFVAGGAILVVLSLVGTVVMGLRYTPSRSAEFGDGLPSLLTERRVALWSEALDIIEDSPLTGLGPGSFGLESPTARSDPDARWAHNEFLQLGAETGVIGLLLLLAVVLWAFVGLMIGRGHPVTTALAASALAALAIQASVDYVLRFPGLPLVTAALVGSAVALGRTLGAPAERAYA